MLKTVIASITVFHFYKNITILLIHLKLAIFIKFKLVHRLKIERHFLQRSIKSVYSLKGMICHHMAIYLLHSIIPAAAALVL
jgi:hypothetical protein